MFRPAPSQAASRSAWPTVLGIIGTVWGGFSIIGAFCGVAMVPFWSWYASTAGHTLPPGQAEQLERMSDFLIWMIASGLISFILAVLLLVGSLSLLKRCAMAMGLLRTWAIGQLFWTPIGTAIGLWMMLPLDFAGADDPAMRGGVIGGTIGGIIGAVFGMILGLALPIFVLIWFARSAVRQELARWRCEAARAGDAK
jgi:hypothetical protein